MGREETITVPVRCQSTVRHQHQIQLLRLISTLRAKAEAREENLAPRKSNGLDTNCGASHGLALSPQKSNSYWSSPYGWALESRKSQGEPFSRWKNFVCNTKSDLRVCISGSVPRELQRCGCFPPYGGS